MTPSLKTESPAKINFQTFQIAADDWGLSKETNAAILELAQLGIVRRVSILSTLRDVRHGLSDLLQIPGLSLGLHFNLTDRAKRRSPSKILFDWLVGGKPARRSLIIEFETQLNDLLQLGVKPNHFDGHEHIHLLPGFVREVAGLLTTSGISTVRVPLDWGLACRIQAPIIPLSLSLRRDLKRLKFNYLPFAYPGREIFKDVHTLARYLNAHRDFEILTHPARSIDDELRHYDQRFLSERVQQYETLKALLKA